MIIRLEERDQMIFMDKTDIPNSFKYCVALVITKHLSMKKPRLI